MALPAAELRRTARQLALPGFGIVEQERLFNAHVLVIGAGGLGCPAMQSLAAAGIGTISVIDNDVVDISNIHRQILFGASDLNQPKVHVAKRRLEEIQPGISVHSIEDRLSESNALSLFSEVDVVVDGSDSFSTKYLAADASEITGTPLVWGTVLRFHGDLAFFNSGPKPRDPGFRGIGLRDLFPDQPDASFVPDCANAGVLGATTAVMGALMATQTIAHLAGLPGCTPGLMLSYDASSASTRSFHISADPQRKLVNKLQSSYDQATCAVYPEANKLLEEVRRGEMLAIDIREPHETLLSDIPQDLCSIKLPLSSILSIADIRAALRGQGRVLIYCASGKRSADFIERYDFPNTELISLPGGLNGLSV